jgi:hypothetical protein
MTMNTGLKTLLRMDPDSIFVGEIRDSEAAEIAVWRGHQIWSERSLKMAHPHGVAPAIPSIPPLLPEQTGKARPGGSVHYRDFLLC